MSGGAMLVASGAFALDGDLGDAWLLPVIGVGNIVYGAAAAGWFTPRAKPGGRGRHEG
jgi:hypothetical protein